jgi:sulfite reductase (NADPH) hemoprotein beta-component
VDNHGIKWFKEEVERRNGWLFEPAKPFLFTERGDAYGWERDLAGKWHYTLFIENGRVLDEKGLAMKSAILEIAKSKTANFRFTGNQNVIIADIDGKDKPIVEGILDRFGIRAFMDTLGLLRKNSMACVSLPTCPLALAEAQRYLPGLIDKLETLLSHHGLEEEQIVIRMTGCPNGCARPYLAEIGLIGTAPGRYNLHLGGDYEGTRLNRLFRESLGENEIILELDGLFRRFRSERNPKEGFGDFVMRKIFV